MTTAAADSPPEGRTLPGLWAFSRRERIGLAGLMVLALAFRLYWIHHNRLWEHVEVFEAGQTALRIIAGQGFTGQYHYAPDGPTAVPYPFYTLFLAAWYGLFGPDRFQEAHYPIMLVQCLAGSLMPALAYAIGRRLFNGPIGALGAVAVAFDYFLAIACGYISQVLWEVLAMLLVALAAIGVCDRPGARRAAGLGAAIGLGTYVKTTLLLTLPAVALWLWLRTPTRRPRRLALLAVVTVVTLLVLSPLVVRNYRAFGRWGVLNNSGGLNFWQGNCEFANGGTYAADGTHIQHLVPPALRAEVSRLNEADGSAVFYREGWRWAREHPWLFLKLRAKTLFYAFYNQNYWMDPAIFPYNPVLKWITVALVTGCLVGIAFSRPWWRGHSLLVAIIGVQTAVYSLYHADIDNRFRLPLEPFLLMYGSALLWRLGAWFQTRYARSRSMVRLAVSTSGTPPTT